MHNHRIAGLLFVSLMALPIAFTSCGGGDEDPIVNEEGNHNNTLTESIKLRRTSIENGATVDAYGLKEISLYYNNTVTVSPTANITLNGTKVSAATSASSKMEIVVNLGTLSESTSYTLNIPSGSIVGMEDNTMTAPAFTLSFSTAEAAAPRASAISTAASREVTGAVSSVRSLMSSRASSAAETCRSVSSEMPPLPI